MKTRLPSALIAAVIPLALVVLGCASGESEAFAPRARTNAMAAAPGEGADFAAPVAASRATGGLESRDGSELVAATGASVPEQPSQQRLRVYSGSLNLSVPRVDAAREAIIEYAASIDGYVEFSDASSVVVRVPAARFNEAMDAIAAEGTVEARSIETADVTDQYADLSRRLQIATTARDRLYQLLEQSTDADDRVAILREIRRLTEEVERLQSSLDSLSALVSFSRISVRLTPRIQVTQQLRDEIPFPWIARLDPLTATVGESKHEIRLVAPDDFAVFSKGRRILAEAADGSRLRIGAIVNEPAGDAGFWTDALSFHLGPFYKSADRTTAGDNSGVLFASKDAPAFCYLVLVKPVGDELLVTEAFFPNEEARDLHLAGIRSMLEGESP